MQSTQLHRLATILASAFFVAAWSSGFLVAKFATSDASPLTLLLWRFLPLALGLGIWAGVRGGFRGITGRDLCHQATIGLLAQLGYCVFVYASVFHGVASGTTALTDAVQPIVIATLVGPLLGVTVRTPQWFGLVIGGAGATLVVWSQSGEIEARPLALLFPLAAMGCLIAATLLDRRFPTNVPVSTALAVHAIATTVALVALCAITRSFTPPDDISFWLATVIAAIGPTLAGYAAYWFLLRRTGVTALNGLLFLVAPTTAVAGALLFAETLTTVTWMGFLLCAAGVTLVLLWESRRSTEADEAGATTNTSDAQRV